VTWMRATTWFGLIALLAVTAALSLSIGAATEGQSVLLRFFAGATTDAEFAVLGQIRVPRLALGLLVGAGLAVAGVLMQAVLANPLAEPGIIGVAAAAGFGALLAVASFGQATWVAPIFGTLLALAALLFAYRVSWFQGRSERLTLILAGIALAAVFSAAISALAAIMGGAVRDQIVFWQFGSLNGASWWQLEMALPMFAVGLALALTVARQLDIFVIGEDIAKTSGVSVARLRLISFAAISILVAMAVSFVGVIAFVGLIVPHALRLLLGPSHRQLIIASVFGGAIVVAAADLLARSAIAGAELPLGMLIALVGGPVFLTLVLTGRKRAGGWA